MCKISKDYMQQVVQILIFFKVIIPEGHLGHMGEAMFICIKKIVRFFAHFLRLLRFLVVHTWIRIVHSTLKSKKVQFEREQSRFFWEDDHSRKIALLTVKAIFSCPHLFWIMHRITQFGCVIQKRQYFHISGALYLFPNVWS